MGDLKSDYTTILNHLEKINHHPKPFETLDLSKQPLTPPDILKPPLTTPDILKPPLVTLTSESISYSNWVTIQQQSLNELLNKKTHNSREEYHKYYDDWIAIIKQKYMKI